MGINPGREDSQSPAPLGQASPQKTQNPKGSAQNDSQAIASQPFGSAQELSAITAPTLIVPGGDPEHPAWIAAMYRRHLVIPTESTVTTDGYATAITAFLD